MNKEGRYLITGGTGSIGQALISRLTFDGFSRLVTMARNESDLILLKDRFPRLEVIAGDIADQANVHKSMAGTNGIFHLAAFKHVHLAESETYQCVKTNILGTVNLLRASLDTRPDFLLFVSTDKASSVKGVYSATKFLGERLVSDFAKANPNTLYRSVRFGNIWDTNGSFVKKWLLGIKNGSGVTLTDPRATRFFFTQEEAIALILGALESHSPYLPSFYKAISMATVLEAFRDKFGDFPVKVIGLQKGENLHETLDGVTYSDTVDQYTKEEFARKFMDFELTNEEIMGRIGY